VHLTDLICATPGGGDTQRDSTKSQRTAWEASQRVKLKRSRLGQRERIGSSGSDDGAPSTRISGIISRDGGASHGSSGWSSPVFTPEGLTPHSSSPNTFWNLPGRT